jgi:hypothetical protein
LGVRDHNSSRLGYRLPAGVVGEAAIPATSKVFAVMGEGALVKALG